MKRELHPGPIHAGFDTSRRYLYWATCLHHGQVEGYNTPKEAIAAAAVDAWEHNHKCQDKYTRWVVFDAMTGRLVWPIYGLPI